MNNYPTHPNPYNPREVRQQPHPQFDPNSARKYPLVPTPPIKNQNALPYPPYQGYQQEPLYPQLNPINPQANNPTQPVSKYPSFPSPPTGPQHKYAPSFSHNSSFNEYIPPNMHQNGNRLPQINEESRPLIENQEQSNKPQTFTCYSIWLYIGITFTVNFMFLATYFMLKKSNYSLFSPFILSFWAFVQFILAIQAIRRKSIERATKAIWFMKGYVIVLICHIIYFASQMFSHHDHHHRHHSTQTNQGSYGNRGNSGSSSSYGSYGNRGNYGSYGGQQTRSGYNSHYGGYYGAGYGSEAAKREENLFTPGFCFWGLFVVFMLHCFVTLYGARKVRDSLKKEEERRTIVVSGEEPQIRVN